MKTLALLPAALAATLYTAAFAQSQQTPVNANANSLVATCAGCHGANGEGNAASNFPRIAGQPKSYLARQLMNYANGSRKNPVMEPIAKGLTPQQIDAIAAYYAAQSPPAPRAAAQDGKNAQALRRGEMLATVGDDKLGVQGCANCHGPGGAGEPPAYPYRGGQHAGYHSAALAEWRSGARNTDPSLQMNSIAKRLSDADIAALANYYAAQSPPAPETQRMNTAAGTPQRPAASPSAAAQRGTDSPAVGAEQGEPTSGGSQGAGGGGAATGSGSRGGGQPGPGTGKP